jgi:hypothetical protein
MFTIIFLVQFMEYCWQIVIYSCPFETHIIVRAFYRVFENGCVNGVRNNDCFILLQWNKNRWTGINLRQAYRLSICLSVTPRSTCWPSSLWPVTVPHDFSHKTNNCQYISQHQQIERRLQVSDIDSIVRVTESRNVQLWLHFQFLKHPFIYTH